MQPYREEPLALFPEDEPSLGGALAVREVSTETTRRWVTDWHYLRRMPGAGWSALGVFAPDLMAVVVLGLPANPHGVSARLGLGAWPGNMEITRVVAHPLAPKNTASRAIAACVPMWRARGYRWVFSFADSGQGHHGGIYQALNAVYLGLTPPRPGYLANGEVRHPRSLVMRYGTQAWPAVRDLAAAEGVKLEKVTDAVTAKHLYVLPTGLPAERRAIRKHLEPLALPYPKRQAMASAA